MRSHTSSTPARRTLRKTERRTRRRPLLIAATLAIGALTTVGITATAPASQAEASGSDAVFTLASYTTPTAGAAEAIATETDAAAALATAGAALSAAATVAADISASGLDIGVPETSVDTTALEAAVAQLERAEVLPEAFVPYFSEPVTALATSVGEQTMGLRGRLDAAHAIKAQQEAAEQARLQAEAEAAAAAAAAAAAKQAAKPAAAAPSPAYATGGAVGGSSPADAQATARSMLAGYGWGDDQFSCLVSLWNKESGWNYRAHNASSGAHGIPQALPGSKMASAGADWQTNAATQIAWGFGYISGRYGTPCGAWSHSQSVGWY